MLGESSNSKEEGGGVPSLEKESQHPEKPNMMPSQKAEYNRTQGKKRETGRRKADDTAYRSRTQSARLSTVQRGSLKKKQQ